MKAVFKPTKKKVVIIVLVLVVIIGAVSYFNAKAKAALAAAEPMYNTAAVEKKDLKKEVSVNGTIGSVDKKSVVADISGVEVTEVNVKVGDQVKAGDVLCTFDSSSIDNKIANTKESADLAAQKSNQAVSDAQTSYNDAVA
ncbi:MAG: HlyD family secretion protein, partial [Lachnospiraceae bacterium]|nr:HlyD family secretion protein [Lachnospiraceae bacterium]